jgi:sterol 14alpha-demethylase
MLQLSLLMIVLLSQTIWSILLRNFEFHLVDPFPEADYSGMVVGPTPCRIRYKRRSKIIGA